LQELIAPDVKVLFADDWNRIEVNLDCLDVLVSARRIALSLLGNRDLLSTSCTAERFSWASKRKTTRSEDMTYSLMGLFNFHMSVLYGEGGTKAFR
jgi:hypothetical protein